MEVIAALGDAPTAAIAVVAIGLGLFLAARGPRETRAGAADGGEAPGPAMVTLPVGTVAEAEPDAEPGFVGPEGDVVGHGPIRLGVHGPQAGGEPAPEPAVAEPVAAEPRLPVPAPAPDREPGWRVAARAANSAVHFRQGTIKIGGKPVDKRKDG